MKTRFKPIVAAFDFDETLTTKDTIIPFLTYAVGKRRTYLAVLRIVPKLLGFYLNKYSRQDIKEALFSLLLAGKSYSEIESIGRAFAQEKIPELLNPTLMERLHWHQKQKHQCILISGAMDFYVEPWGKLKKFDHVLASRCQVNSQGLITGRLLGENCWGQEKVVRLKELLGPKKGYTLYAYGDSEGDNELLQLADYPFYRYQEKKQDP